MSEEKENPTDKAWRELREYVDEEVANQVEFYSERYPYTWDEAVKNDVPDAILKNEKFKQLFQNYISHIKNEV